MAEIEETKQIDVILDTSLSQEGISVQFLLLTINNLNNSIRELNDMIVELRHDISERDRSIEEKDELINGLLAELNMNSRNSKPSSVNRGSRKKSKVIE